MRPRIRFDLRVAAHSFPGKGFQRFFSDLDVETFAALLTLASTTTGLISAFLTILFFGRLFSPFRLKLFQSLESMAAIHCRRSAAHHHRADCLDDLLSCGSYPQRVVNVIGDTRGAASGDRDAQRDQLPAFANAQNINPELDELRRSGWDAVYNLYFDAARATFTELQQRAPQHQAGDLMMASLTWIEQLNRSRRLQINLYRSAGFLCRSETGKRHR
jgi:hypothetical protein